jgi:hypothetical protein
MFIKHLATALMLSGALVVADVAKAADVCELVGSMAEGVMRTRYLLIDLPEDELVTRGMRNLAPEASPEMRGFYEGLLRAAYYEPDPVREGGRRLVATGFGLYFEQLCADGEFDWLFQ